MRLDGVTTLDRDEMSKTLARASASPSQAVSRGVTDSDETLLGRITVGDSTAMETLAARYWGPLFAYAFRFSGGDRALAEDAVQDAFLRILKQRSYRPPAPARPWIYRIATNCVLDRIRGERRPEPLGGDPAVASASADDQAILLERAECVRAAVAGLPVELRSVLVLRYSQDLSLAEVSDTLGIPLGTVKSRLHSAISRLRASQLMEVDG